MNMTYEEYILNKIRWDKSIEEYWYRMKEVDLLDEAKRNWSREYRFYEKFQEERDQWSKTEVERFVFLVFEWIEYFIEDVEKLDIVFLHDEIALVFDGNEVLVGDKMYLNGEFAPNPEVLIDKLFKIYGK